MSEGLVIKAEANFYSVAVAESVYLCTMRANLRKAGLTIKVGDRVLLEALEDERPVEAELLPRRNELPKPAIANIDQVLIVMSALQPEFNAMLVDRLLLSVTHQGLTPVVCISKADLMDEELREWLLAEYAPFDPICLSAHTGEGLAQLQARLMGKVSVLSGASGVGKSSVINRLNPDFHLSVGEVNQKIGLGKHTTRHVSLHPISWQGQTGWVADSPGFSVCELPPIEPVALADFYPEFRDHLGQCAFGDCLHREGEDTCAIIDSIDTESERYYNYLRLLAEIEERTKERRATTSKIEVGTKKAVGKNRHEQILRLDTAARATSRRTLNQDLERLVNLAELDPEALEDAL